MALHANCIKCGKFSLKIIRGMCRNCCSHDWFINNRVRHKELRDIWYSKNKDKKHAKDRELLRKRKLRALDLCGGRRCIKCGCDDVDLLEFNYIPGGHSKLRKEGKLPGSGWLHTQLLDGRVNPKLFDIRCKVCNVAYYLELKFNRKFSITYLQPK